MGTGAPPLLSSVAAVRERLAQLLPRGSVALQGLSRSTAGRFRTIDWRSAATIKGVAATLAALLTYTLLVRRRRGEIERHAQAGTDGDGRRRRQRQRETEAETAGDRDGDDWHGATPEIRLRRRNAAAVARQLYSVRATRESAS